MAENFLVHDHSRTLVGYWRNDQREAYRRNGRKQQSEEPEPGYVNVAWTDKCGP